jgi:hypothetical protein
MFTEFFSNIRLIDYFVKFETQITAFNFNINENSENLNIFNIENLSLHLEDKRLPFEIEYSYLEFNLPLKEYKNIFDLNLNLIKDMLPKERLYMIKPNNKFFSMIFVDSNKNFKQKI